MIISCEKCNKNFEISENLIPDEGRLLECGSCSYQWHYIPRDRIKLVNEVKIDDSSTNEDISKKLKKKSKKQKTNKKVNINNNDFSPIDTSTSKNKSVGFLSYLLITVISFIAFIILIDTFKTSINSFIPGLDFYLSSLYESLKDILLFFKDLIK